MPKTINESEVIKSLQALAQQRIIKMLGDRAKEFTCVNVNFLADSESFTFGFQHRENKFCRISMFSDTPSLWINREKASLGELCMILGWKDDD